MIQDLYDRWFIYHSPTAEQVASYQELRDAAKSLADVVMRLCPDCADKSAAIRKIREAVMTANASIACEVKS